MTDTTPLQGIPDAVPPVVTEPAGDTVPSGQATGQTIGSGTHMQTLACGCHVLTDIPVATVHACPDHGDQAVTTTYQIERV